MLLPQFNCWHWLVSESRDHQSKPYEFKRPSPNCNCLKDQNKNTRTYNCAVKNPLTKFKLPRANILNVIKFEFFTSAWRPMINTQWIPNFLNRPFSMGFPFMLIYVAKIHRLFNQRTRARIYQATKDLSQTLHAVKNPKLWENWTETATGRRFSSEIPS